MHRALLLAAGAVGCATGEGQPYPPLDSSADCLSHPHLCELAAEDLGGGDHPRAYHIVFLGDGYEPTALSAYRDEVDRLVQGLRQDPNGFVSWHPDMYRFHRVDVASRTSDVNDVDRTDTALGAFNNPESDACHGRRIEAHPPLVALAARNAGIDADAVVVIAHDSEGRENGGVHVSSRSGVRVLRHELGHALFGLQDEYTEFLWCSSRASTDEAVLLPTPNVTARRHPAKWGSLVDSYQGGGGRWPCLYHPTSSCSMLDSGSERFCPVCEAAIREHVAGRRCDADGRPPRVAFAEQPPVGMSFSRSGTTRLLHGAAYDERGIGSYRFLVDGEVVGDGPWPWYELDVSALAEGDHELAVEAVDGAGRIGRSAPHHLQLQHQREQRPTATITSVEPDTAGWIHVVASATPYGGELDLVLGGNVTRLPIDATESVSVWLASDPSLTEGAIVTAVARTAGGVESAPVTAAVPAHGVFAIAEPTVTAATIAGVAVTDIDAVDSVVDIDVHVTSCSPLAAVWIESDDGTVLGTTAVTPVRGCAHTVTVRMGASANAAELTLRSRDRWGRAGDELRFAAPALVDAEALCGLRPRAVGMTASLARPLQIALGTVAEWRARVGDREAPVLRATVDGAPGGVLAAADIPGGPYDGDRVAVAVTAVAPCDGSATAATVDIDVTVDAVAPALRVHPFAQPWLVVDAGDAGDAQDVVARFDAAIDVEPPFEVPAGAGSVVVRASDGFGNASEVTSPVYAWRPYECEPPK